MESAESVEPKEKSCCEAYFHGLCDHIDGFPDEAKENYQKALEGNHFNARKFLIWITNDLDVVCRVPAEDILSAEKMKQYAEAAREDPRLCASETEAERRGLELSAELGSHTGKAAPYLHTLSVLDDCNALNITPGDLVRSVRRAGPAFNQLDDEGVPIPGMIRARDTRESEGWFHLSGVRITGGRVSVVGSRSGPLPALLTSEDVDVAIGLAFLEGDAPSRPSLGLNRVSGGFVHSRRLNIKHFNPPWLSETAFGQSMFLADWLMKATTMKNGVPSFTDPFFSAAMNPEWQPTALIEAISKADGHHKLPDGTEAESGRLEIVVRGVGVVRGTHRKNLFRRITEYKINDIKLKIESSLRRYGQDGSVEDFCDNDPTTSPGASAKVIEDHYDLLAEQFPVFYRVKTLLGLFATLCQARRDGLTLSRSERIRISREIAAYKLAQTSRTEYSPKPFHRGGCYCEGGVSGGTDADVLGSVSGPLPMDCQVNFVVSPNSFATPIPEGAGGPHSPTSGDGMWYSGGSGGHGYDARTTDVLIMDANNNQGTRSYYLNFSGQKVDPFTGRTISQDHPMAHIYHDTANRYS